MSISSCSDFNENGIERKMQGGNMLAFAFQRSWKIWKEMVGCLAINMETQLLISYIPPECRTDTCVYKREGRMRNEMPEMFSLWQITAARPHFQTKQGKMTRLILSLDATSCFCTLNWS